MTTTTTDPSTKHQCDYAWCVRRSDGDSHFTSAYTTATGRRNRLQETIGVCLSFSPDDGDAVPRLLVHIMDEDGEVDVDACVTVDEAIELRDLLDVAISHAFGFEAVAQ